MKKVIILLFLTILHFCSAHFANAQTNEKWLQDYEAMKKFMAEAYANLEWARNDKKIDLVALDKKTKEELSKAASDQEARQVLENFLKTFRDGHLNLREVKETSAQNTSEPQSFALDAPGDKVCSALGYRIRFNKFSIPFEQAPNFKLVSSSKDNFPAGIFTLENGKSYGVLKIGLFSSDGYFNNCTASWEEFRTKLTESCTNECINKFHRATDNRLSAKLAEQIKILQEQKIDNLIVDIGGNGGGSNWVEAAARILSPKTLRSTSSGFIRHPHYVKILENRLKDVSEDLARKDLNAKQKGYLKTAKERLEQLVKEAKSPCDRSNFWTGENVKPGCTLLNQTPSGIFDYLPSKEIANLRSKSILFMPSEFEFEESVFKGNLIALVDGKTASAAEHFASLMQLNKSATVIGETTLGAGCGYVNGGTKYFLPNSKLQLRMPDCVRYRADGKNEVSGVKPDIVLWEVADDKPKRLEKLLVHLAKAQ